MKSSLRKLRGFALHRHDSKKKREHHPPTHQDELLQASQDMSDMRNCYDNLLYAAAATANSAHEFSEALREMGTCLLDKTALNDDEESGHVLLLLGKVQFELQKLVDSYRVHIVKTITTPSESLLKELQTVEEMKRQCDDKRDMYKFMLAAQREKGRSKNANGESFSPQLLQAAQEDYQQEATLFVFRLKSLKQGQSRSLLTQAARHHAAQLNFFRKGVRSLEVVEPHVKAIAEQHHIDYQFSGLEDDTEDDDDDDADENNYDGNDDDELSFAYGQNNHGQGHSVYRNSTELDQLDQTNAPTSTTETAQENIDHSQAETPFSRGPRVVSLSEPLLADKRFEPSERIKQMQPSSTRKFHTYVLPTPVDVKSSDLAGSGTSVSAPRLERKDGWPTQLWHSSPLRPNMHVKEFRNDELSSPTRLRKAQLVLKESNANSGPIRMPSPLNEGLPLPQANLLNALDSNRIKRQAYSGPLTSQARPGKPTFSVDYHLAASAKPTHFPMPQPSTSQNMSPRASPPIASPRINELHELPRPPNSSVKSARPSSIIGHSAPLVCRGQELYATSKMQLNASQTASPLPTPPVVMARSFSIPSSSPGTPSLAIAKMLEVPQNQSRTTDVSSPPLRPISLINVQSTSTISESVAQATKAKDLCDQNSL
ncbi:uncharacterized protein At2g33490-like isoform X2 [Phoenix dactylifera]|uniref:Uncharacterized protein At2g33490-like isoform X2 n=1 Tax=Phoenix dactylifera TaxID=42345 RepID=A0A8B8J8T7_PHODC|nr:uncharacterized protein At2g33490-like isoform X2 [Phoenix dactylifera]